VRQEHTFNKSSEMLQRRDPARHTIARVKNELTEDVTSVQYRVL
jgi:hypothetical protein